MKPIHIVLSGNNAWGMWNFRGILCKHLIEKGYTISVVAPYNQDFFQKFEEIGCQVYDIPVNAKGVNPVEDFYLYRKYVKLFKKIRPDISFTYTIKPNIYASIAAAQLGIKYIPITTGLGYTFLSSGLIPKIARSLYKYAFRKAEEVWFLNRDDINTFKAAKLVANEKVVHLPGEGIDLARFSTDEADIVQHPLSFLLVGRMLKDKGVVEFVEAARQLKVRYPDITFQLLGAVWKDNPAAIDERTITAWNNDGVVQYLGSTNDVKPFLEAASCIVLPSYREGVPCTLMEGAAMRKPLIATDVPGCREVVKDGYNGFLCLPRNVESLVSALEKIILLSETDRLRLGNNGRKLMEDIFDIKIILETYDETIKKLIQ